MPVKSAFEMIKGVKHKFINNNNIIIIISILL